MRWTAASFVLVAIALAIGWIAYERSRPSARTVALVATLSALAALGRDAFAALPEVKPITAMTFVVGYSLGPLPGFVVGAIGMLASGMLLGQGPYTPWQMVAWGLVGLLGAIVGALSRRRLRRLPLALGCAFAALVAKEIMNVYEWVMGASHTLAALLVVVGKSLPFDVLDVVSTLLFGLAFGPELARLLARMKARTQVEWRPAGGTLGAIGLVLMSLALTGVTAAPAARATAVGSAASQGALVTREVALRRGVAYLRSAEKSDGGFGASQGAQSSEMYTAWTMIGLAAAGRLPCSIAKDGRSPLDFLRAGVGALSGAGAIERTILALHACGVPAGSLAGDDLSAKLMGFRKADGSFGGQVSITAFAIFALRSAGDNGALSAIEAAGSWLIAQQNADGGFSFGTRGDPSDVDDTAAAMQGIVAAGHSAPRALARAIAYLRDAENGDGGFPQQRGGESNAQSTAWAIQGMVAARQPLDSKGRSPMTYEERLVAADGSVNYAKGVEQTPVWVTAEALAALAKRPFPIGPPVTDRGASASSAGGANSAGGPESAGGEPASPRPRSADPSRGLGISRLAVAVGGIGRLCVQALFDLLAG